MRKIPTIFERDFDGNPARVLREKTPECLWVFDGEGVATRKYDGTCCMFDGQNWFKRRKVKPGKSDPFGFDLVSTDEKTGKRVGWILVDHADKWHLVGIANTPDPAAGTYELIGPKVQGNPDGAPEHVMISHETAERVDCPRDFDGMDEWLRNQDLEGVVFHHPDGRMAKIKRRDFGHRN